MNLSRKISRERGMRAVRAHGSTPDTLALETLEVPVPEPGEVLVEVHAAAVTRDELTWPEDRLPAIPSYEISGVVAEIPPEAEDLAVGDAVYALMRFDRDGGAAEYAVVAADGLAGKPQTLDHVVAAALPLAGLSAWQGLFDHGKLTSGQRVLIHGATGGVGHLATQLARWRGAHVIATAGGARRDEATRLGAHEVLDAQHWLDAGLEPVDLVFDTSGGELLAQSSQVVRDGGRLVSVAEEPPQDASGGVDTSFFIVEQSGQQLAELARLADEGVVRPAIDAVFGLDEAQAAFERSMQRGKQGKVVLRIT
jgi:NADPH:quinone reductase-like Zn-dependent oxidoreductase